MDPSQFSETTLLGKFIRLPFKFLRRDAVVRILRGPARGQRWIAGSTTRGFWLGYWELENQRLFASHLHEGDVVYDIGAHVGLYTLLSSVRVKEDGHVYAFEPLDRNVLYLRRHIELNHISNCTVMDVAVSDSSGCRHFDPTINDTAGHFSNGGGLVVPTVSIDEFLASSRDIRPPNALKINAEGAELEVLTGGRETIAQHSPLIFLSTHSRNLARKCTTFLHSAGYVVAGTCGDKIWAEKSR